MYVFQSLKRLTQQKRHRLLSEFFIIFRGCLYITYDVKRYEGKNPYR